MTFKHIFGFISYLQCTTDCVEIFDFRMIIKIMQLLWCYEQLLLRRLYWWRLRNSSWLLNIDRCSDIKLYQSILMVYNDCIRSSYESLLSMQSHFGDLQVASFKIFLKVFSFLFSFHFLPHFLFLFGSHCWRLWWQRELVTILKGVKCLLECWIHNSLVGLIFIWGWYDGFIIPGVASADTRTRTGWVFTLWRGLSINLWHL